ncbi:phage holin, partial [Shigella sonnei]
MTNLYFKIRLLGLLTYLTNLYFKIREDKRKWICPYISRHLLS